MVQIDIPMPNSCEECDLTRYGHWTESEYCCITDKCIDQMVDRRDKDCPLVEVDKSLKQEFEDVLELEAKKGVRLDADTD